MLDKIKQIISEIGSFTATTPAEVEQFRIKHLSKKGTIAALFDDFKNVPADQKKEIGKALNELKTAALDKVNELKEKLCNSDPISCKFIGSCFLSKRFRVIIKKSCSFAGGRSAASLLSQKHCYVNTQKCNYFQIWR